MKLHLLRKILPGALALVLVSSAAVSSFAAEGEKKLSKAAQAYDKDGDGKLNDEEEAARKADIAAKAKATKEANLKKYDKDGDGKLNEEEKAAKKADDDAAKAAKKAERDAKKAKK